MSYAKGTKGFLQWIKAKQPKVYAEMVKRAPRAQLNGLGLTDLLLDANTAPSTATPPTWLDSLKTLALTASQVYLTKEQLKSQNKIMDMQLQRAQQGLAPLDVDMSQWGIPQAQVGLNTDTKKFLMYGGIAAGVLLLVSMMTGKRRHG